MSSPCWLPLSSPARPPAADALTALIFRQVPQQQLRVHAAEAGGKPLHRVLRPGAGVGHAVDALHAPAVCNGEGVEGGPNTGGAICAPAATADAGAQGVGSGSRLGRASSEQPGRTRGQRRRRALADVVGGQHHQVPAASGEGARMHLQVRGGAVRRLCTFWARPRGGGAAAAPGLLALHTSAPVRSSLSNRLSQAPGSQQEFVAVEQRGVGLAVPLSRRRLCSLGMFRRPRASRTCWECE